VSVLQGLWFGIMSGLVVQMLLLLYITLSTNWEKEVSKSAKTLVMHPILIVLLASQYLEFSICGL
jgi:MATE family multidrug resistance protein